MKKLSLIFALLFFGSLAHAQTYQNLDDAPGDSAPEPGWQWPPCVGGSPLCPGGENIPTSYNQTFNNGLPAPNVDGGSMFLTETTDAPYSNIMFPRSVGADDSDTLFIGSYYAYIQNPATFQIFGSDMYQFSGSVRYMFGTQCGITSANIWSVWNAGTQTWEATSVPCPFTGRLGGPLSTSITSIVCTSGTPVVCDSTVASAAGFYQGDSITVAGNTNSALNGTHTITLSGGTSIYFTIASPPDAYGTGGTITDNATGWHQITYQAHRIPGDTSCGGGSCEYYDYIIQDGTQYNLNVAYPSGSNSHSDDRGIQFDVSGNTVSGILGVYIDELTFTATVSSPAFTSAASTSFTAGTAGSFTIAATGVPAPTFTVTGTLPSGVTLVNNGNGTATLSGTPAPGTGGVYTVTLTASNGVSPNAFQTFTLTVDALPVFTSATSVSFTEGQPSSFNVAATGYPVPAIFLYAGTLPAGLIFTSNDGAGTGILSGTPTAAGTTALVFEAFDNPYQIFQNFTLTVNAPVPIAPTPYTLNAVQPPTTSSNTNYAAWESVLSSGNNLFTGATAVVADGCSSACSQTTYVDQGTSYPILSWTAEDALVATYTSQGKKANVLQAASIEGNQNNGTSSYVFTQSWADLLDTDGSGQYRGLVWTSGQIYRTLQYICVGTCPGTGTYWQMTGTVALPGNPGAANYGQGCVAGATEPAFTGAGPYTETATYPCTWTKVGAHAPPQDVSCSPSFTGTNCYSIAITNIVGNGTTVTVTLSAAPTFSAGSIAIAGIANSSYTALNGTWTMNGETSSTVTFLDSNSYTSCNASCLGGSPVVEQTHILNINSTNATTTVLASALPVAYEMPYAVWRNYFCQQTIDHYNPGQLGGGYIVCGYEGGGEYSTFNIGQQPSFSKQVWLSGINDMLLLESQQSPTMPLFGDMNAVGGDYTYTDQEAAIETALSIGMRTNGLEVTDLTNIICSQGVSSAYCTAISTPTPCDNPPASATLGCTSGGWYRNAVTYPTFTGGALAGQPSTLSLQTLNGSQPTNCQVSSSSAIAGPLAPAAASSDCPQGFIGLLNGLVDLRSTGLVNFSGGPVVTVNNAEIYTNGPASCALCSYYDSSAYPVGDILFALDPNYSSTTYAQTSPSVLAQVLPYDASFALFLGAQSVFGACPTSGGAECETATWTLGVESTLSAVAELPQIWVNNNEGNGAISSPTYTVTFPSSGSGGNWSCGATNYGPYTASSSVSAQQVLNDAEACRTANGGTPNIPIVMPAGMVFTSASPLVIPQSSNVVATGFIAVISSADSSLPDGTIVCSHGPQDNLPASTDIGIDNPGCNGSGMYFQLGTAITPVSAGPFTLANGINTNTSAYDDVQYMWTVENSGTNKPTLETCSPLGASSSSVPPSCTSKTIAPDHWLIEDMEARMSVGNTGTSSIVSLVDNGNETSLSQLPTHIHFRKVWSHGDWTTLSAGANAVTTGILLGCEYCSIVDSQVSQILRPGSEGHALGAAWGGQLKIDHNWLEGGSSGFFIGGFTYAPTISGLVPGQDVELRRNRFTFPYTWLGETDSTCGTKGNGTVPHTNPYWGCTTTTSYSLVRKNVWEIKEGQRLLVSGNIFENSDGSGGQSGPIHDFNVRNSSATTYAGSNNYQSVISDVTYQNNIARSSCEGFEVDSSGSTLGNGGGVSFIPTRFSFANDLLYNVSATNPGCAIAGAASVGIYLDSNLQQWKGTITENSAGTQATFVATCSIDGGDCPAGPPSIGFQVFDINPGDAVSISGCTVVTAFNVPTKLVTSYTVPAGIGPLASGTNPASLTVTYPWTTTANAVDNSGNCILTKGQAGPANVSMTHMTFVTDSTHSITSTNGPSAGPNYAINADLQNNIILGGGLFNNPLGVGTPTETFNFDITSFTFDHTVWPTGTASKYTAYGNNPFFPVMSPVLYFPPTPYCTGASPTSSCVGFTGAMSASSMPLNLTDYHNFALMAGSVFKAGGADQASDGTDQGANIPAIDAAQTLNQYVCSTYCGFTGGPYPDH